MKICFVAPNIYPCLSKSKVVEKIGGAELQQIFIGRGLQDRGYEVSYISQNFGQPEVEIIDNLKIYQTFKPDEGIFGIRFFYPRLYKIWKALVRVDADVYYVRCAGFLPGLLSIFCKVYGKKFIFAGAHDTDFVPKEILVSLLRDRLLYQYGLRNAHAIIVQSYLQKKLLRENFNLDGYVIRNFYPNIATKPSDSKKEYILWVSALRPWKRPMQFIRLAKEFPYEKFVMIGGPDKSNKELFKEIEREAEKVENVKFLGFQPLEKTECYFDRCKLFVNTSEFEGFPNTFLQAWSRGIPVISYVDPDNVIKKNKLGLVVNSEQELQESVSTFLANPSWDSDQILEYLKKNHFSGIIDQYCALLNGIG